MYTESLPKHLVDIGIVTVRRKMKVAWHAINLELTHHSTASLLIELFTDVLGYLALGQPSIVVDLTAWHYVSNESLADVDVVNLQHILNIDRHQCARKAEELDVNRYAVFNMCVL
jgi:hypothetical protein